MFTTDVEYYILFYVGYNGKSFIYIRCNLNGCCLWKRFGIFMEEVRRSICLKGKKGEEKGHDKMGC